MEHNKSVSMDGWVNKQKIVICVLAIYSLMYLYLCDVANVTDITEGRLLDEEPWQELLIGPSLWYYLLV